MCKVSYKIDSQERMTARLKLRSGVACGIGQSYIDNTEDMSFDEGFRCVLPREVIGAVDVMAAFAVDSKRRRSHF
jgi:hypothetical protein